MTEAEDNSMGAHASNRLARFEMELQRGDIRTKNRQNPEHITKYNRIGLPNISTKFSKVRWANYLYGTRTG
jgi:hypothetical protein